MRASVLAVVLLTACGGGASIQATSPPPAEVEGLITELGSEGGTITSLTVEGTEGTFEILIDPERDYGFDLTHLNEHRDQRLPVRVALETREDGLYAVRIDDA